MDNIDKSVILLSEQKYILSEEEIEMISSIEDLFTNDLSSNLTDISGKHTEVKIVEKWKGTIDDLIQKFSSRNYTYIKSPIKEPFSGNTFITLDEGIKTLFTEQEIHLFRQLKSPLSFAQFI